jgi:hypothetical protein
VYQLDTRSLGFSLNMIWLRTGVTSDLDLSGHIYKVNMVLVHLVHVIDNTPSQLVVRSGFRTPIKPQYSWQQADASHNHVLNVASCTNIALI